MKNDRPYFGYGSNLSGEELARRGIAAHLEPVGRAWLPDYDLAFTHLSSTRGCGTLDVVHAPGSLAPGFLFRVLDEEGWRLLGRKEGVRVSDSGLQVGAYEPCGAWAFDETGLLVPVRTYSVLRKRDHVSPSREYLDVVRTGRAERAIDTDDLDRVARGDRRANALPNLFVYGTLMRGERRECVLADRRPNCWILAETFGRLVDCGEYPGFVVAGGGDCLVQGEFVRFPDGAIEAVLAAADVMEGFLGHGRAGESLFVRRPIGVGVDGRERRAWVYELRQSDGASAIESRDWRAYHGRREAFLERHVGAHLGGRSEEVAARHIARRDGPFARFDSDGWRSLLPLAPALARGDVSERSLAQFSGDWVVLPE